MADIIDTQSKSLLQLVLPKIHIIGKNTTWHLDPLKQNSRVCAICIHL